jgi:hypothetical protein
MKTLQKKKKGAAIMMTNEGYAIRESIGSCTFAKLNFVNKGAVTYVF